MTCPDCAGDGHPATMVFDAKQMGEVCPRCERVLSIFNTNPTHAHYASERACKARMTRDSKRNMHRSVSTRALVERIMRPID